PRQERPNPSPSPWREGLGTYPASGATPLLLEIARLGHVDEVPFAAAIHLVEQAPWAADLRGDLHADEGGVLATDVLGAVLEIDAGARIDGGPRPVALLAERVGGLAHQQDIVHGPAAGSELGTDKVIGEDRVLEHLRRRLEPDAAGAVLVGGEVGEDGGVAGTALV